MLREGKTVTPVIYRVGSSIVYAASMSGRPVPIPVKFVGMPSHGVAPGTSL